jgi:aspartyl/asparaginyl-tRNA synthetase
MIEKRVSIKEAFKKKDTVVAGWVQDFRPLAKIKFIILRDETGTLQIALPSKNKLFKVDIPAESYILVKGEMVPNKEARGGKELVPSDIQILSQAEHPIPIDISGKIETSLDKRVDWKFLDMRRPEVQFTFKLQSDLVNFMTEFLNKKGFTRIFSSKIVGSPTEGGAEYFPVEYFKKKAFLAQSPQFYKELSLLGGMEKVYEIGTVYRAEPHHTPRHLCEYISFDMEMISDSMEQIMNLEEDMLRDLFKNINTKYNLKLQFPKKIPVLTFSEAKKIVEKMKVKTDPDDLSPEGERAICEYAQKKFKSEFCFITEYPWKHKVFYAKRKNSDSESFDLLYRGLEITTGGLREENYEKRLKNAKDKGFDPKQFDHLRFFKYGMPPHGGLAIGIERLTQQILGLENIREASMTPRDPDRTTP